MQTNQIIYGVQPKLFVLKCKGEMRFTLAPMLEIALNQAKKLLLDEILIDMRQVTCVDSTILGIILHFFLSDEKIQMNFAKSIICDNNDVLKSLKCIGFDKFFNIKTSDDRISDKITYTIVDTLCEDKKLLENYVLKAHQTLSQLQTDKANFELVNHQIRSKR